MADTRSLWAKYLHPRCPFCGEGRIYRGFLTVEPACPHCKAAFSAHDAADGPAFVAMTVIGGLLSVIVLVLEMKYHPPYWVYLAILLPLGMVSLLIVLRISKTAFILARFKLLR